MGLFGNLFKKAYPTITPVEAKKLHDEGALLIDVRESSEYRSGHAPGAKHIALGALNHRLKELSQDRMILVMCQSGARSASAAKMLADEGFQVTNVSGGMVSWKRSGLTVSK